MKTLHDVKQALLTGDACKKRAATAMNERSTRAHNIFVLSLKQTNLSTGVSYTSKLFLADLGGSEQVKKSQVNENPAKGGEQPLIAFIYKHVTEALGLYNLLSKTYFILSLLLLLLIFFIIIKYFE